MDMNAYYNRIEEEHGNCALQKWILRLPVMQQSVLMSAVRGPDGIPKYHPVKFLHRWFRRCVLKSAMDGCVLKDPYSSNGGSFTGPSIVLPAAMSMMETAPQWEEGMDDLVSKYLQSVDELPHHFHLHFMHAAEIIGYKHDDDRIRTWWKLMYWRLVKDMHLTPETCEELDFRLSDNRDNWLAACDTATSE